MSTLKKLPRKLATSLIAPLRRERPQFLFWSVYYPFNFGDWIAPFLFEKITGRESWYGLPSSYDIGSVTMSVGSIMARARENCIVWGSGIKYRDTEFGKPWRVTAVRGPFTYERFRSQGYSCPQVFGDPALLLPRYYIPVPGPISHALGVVPHFRDLERVQRRFDDDKRVRVIDVRMPIEVVVDSIASCRALVSSSLHGLIVAHAYRVPAGWVVFDSNPDGDGTKYFDHFASLGVDSPDVLERALDCSVAELQSFAEAQPQFDVDSICDALLAAFPHARERV